MLSIMETHPEEINTVVMLSFDNVLRLSSIYFFKARLS